MGRLNGRVCAAKQRLMRPQTRSFHHKCQRLQSASSSPVCQGAEPTGTPTHPQPPLPPLSACPRFLEACGRQDAGLSGLLISEFFLSLTQPPPQPHTPTSFSSFLTCAPSIPFHYTCLIPKVSPLGPLVPLRAISRSLPVSAGSSPHFLSLHSHRICPPPACSLPLVPFPAILLPHLTPRPSPNHREKGAQEWTRLPSLLSLRGPDGANPMPPAQGEEWGSLCTQTAQPQGRAQGWQNHPPSRSYLQSQCLEQRPV